MAAGKWKTYDFANKYIGDGTIDLDDTTNWKVALFLSTSNADTLSVGTGIFGDLTNEHAAANGYAAGGVALSGITFNRSGSQVTFSFTSPQWTASGGSIVARFAVVYKNATVNGIVKPLLCVCLLDTTPADVTTTAGNNFTITVSASGVVRINGATVN